MLETFNFYFVLFFQRFEKKSIEFLTAENFATTKFHLTVTLQSKHIGFEETSAQLNVSIAMCSKCKIYRKL